jgi:hypothetical protein
MQTYGESRLFARNGDRLIERVTRNHQTGAGENTGAMSL